MAPAVGGRWVGSVLHVALLVGGATGCRDCQRQTVAAPASAAVAEGERTATVRDIDEPGVVLAGVVTRDREPVAGAVVELYRDASTAFRGAAAYTSAATAADGRFRFELPAGAYFVVGRKEPELHGYFGGNPEQLLAGEEVALGLELVAHREPAAERLPAVGAGTGIRGQVLGAGQPLARALVGAYLTATSAFRGAPDAGAVADDDGRFVIEAPPGSYFVVARRRQSGQTVGPLAIGDFGGYYDRNPVTVPATGFVDLVISCVARDERYERRQRLTTILAGTIVDGDGGPVAGMRVGAYLFERRIGRPEVMSEPTAADGRFTLRLPHGGRYFLIGRDSFGGRPAAAERLGFYDGSTDGAISVVSGEERQDVRLLVAPPAAERPGSGRR